MAAGMRQRTKVLATAFKKAALPPANSRLSRYPSRQFFLSARWLQDFSTGSGQFRPRQPMQPLKIVGYADQRPFQFHLLQSAQQEPPKAQHALDDPKDGLHRLLT